MSTTCACRPAVLVVNLPLALVRLDAFLRSISNALLRHLMEDASSPTPYVTETSFLYSMNFFLFVFS
jgi:hypothetical protein